MIAFLHGQILELAASSVLINVQGVGYEVICSRRCVEGLQEGSPASIVVYTDVKEDSIKLYGFSDKVEKQVFLLLLKVKGLGAKSASDVLSRVDKVELLRAIGSGDVTKLQQIKGIGKKTAERIVLELRDKVAEFALEQHAALESAENGPLADAVEALMALGFTRKQAEGAVKQATGAGEEARDSGQIVKDALRYI